MAQMPVEIGENGEKAPAIGAGLLPLFSTYAPNLISLLKSDAVASLAESRRGRA